MILFSTLLQISYCTVIGIDLGSDSIKIAVGSKEKKVHLINNYYSNPTTPNIFAFRDIKNWAYGEGAIAQCRAYPDTCIQNQRIPLNDKTYFSQQQLRGFQIAAISLKQIVQNIKTKDFLIFKDFKKDDEMKIVIAIPPSMTNREKSYLQTALAMANVSCIRFITSTYAPIETYVNEQIFWSTFNTAIFIDLGHSGIRVSGFKFYKSKNIQKFQIFNDTVGGQTIDQNLFKMVTLRYNIEPKNEKMKYILLTRLRKAREQLTNSSEVTFEFQSKNLTISAKDVDICCVDIKDNLKRMFETIKEDHENILQSSVIQLLGGCSQIPSIKSYIHRLIPNVEISDTMEPFSTVAKGAVYVVDDEIDTNVREHTMLVPNEVVLKSSTTVYSLFSRESSGGYSPVVSVTSDELGREFRVVEVKSDGREEEYVRFKVDLPSSKNTLQSSEKVDLAFKMSDFLRPYPVESEDLSFYFMQTGWEISSAELSRSIQLVNAMAETTNNRLKVEVKSPALEGYKSDVQGQLKKFGIMGSWRKASFAGICVKIDYAYSACLEQNDYECPASKTEAILDEFKSLVKSYMKMDDDEDDDKDKKDGGGDEAGGGGDGREQAIIELKSMIRTCQILEAEYSDAEEWLKKNQKKASIREIYKYVGILEERAKSAKKKGRENL